MTIYLDSNILIYWIERTPLWFPKVELRLRTVLAAGDNFAVSDLTRAECLIGPFKSGNTKVESQFETFFNNPAVTVFAIVAASCVRSARIRASMNIKLPDALHLAIATEEGCDLFLTNDGRLKRYPDIPVEVLS